MLPCHYFAIIAERVGFEPTLPCGKHAFQACSFGHSDTSPGNEAQIYKIYSSPHHAGVTTFLIFIVSNHKLITNS
jgi:hypothetical protein